MIDFSNPAERYSESDHLRFPRQPELYSTLEGGSGAERDSPAPSHTVPVFLPFPGAEHARPARAALRSVAPPPAALAAAPALPTAAVGGKQFYIGIFFKANWYRAEQYCRYHGMHLASVGSEAEQRDLQEHITSFGLGNEHFWSSGTDQVRYSQLNFTILTAFRQRRASSSGCLPASRSRTRTGTPESRTTSSKS